MIWILFKCTMIQCRSISYGLTQDRRFVVLLCILLKSTTSLWPTFITLTICIRTIRSLQMKSHLLVLGNEYIMICTVKCILKLRSSNANLCDTLENFYEIMSKTISFEKSYTQREIISKRIDLIFTLHQCRHQCNKSW